MLPSFIRMMRPQQWYKNLLVFLPLVFAGHLFASQEWMVVLMGFIALCFCSSFNYIVNDWKDISKDREHPEKKNRPLASGEVSIFMAGIEATILLVIGIFLAFQLKMEFGLATTSLVLLSLAYSFVFKNIPFADILVVAINFVLRAAAGTFLLNIAISPWLIVCTFFLALFLLAGKRYGDAQLLGEKAPSHKETLAVYTKDVTNALMIIATALIILAYTAYTIFSNHPNLIFSLPIALFVFFRYFYLVHTHSPISRHPEKVFSDKEMIIGMIAWGTLIMSIIYWPN